MKLVSILFLISLFGSCVYALIGRGLNAARRTALISASSSVRLASAARSAQQSAPRWPKVAVGLGAVGLAVYAHGSKIKDRWLNNVFRPSEKTLRYGKLEPKIEEVEQDGETVKLVTEYNPGDGFIFFPETGVFEDQRTGKQYDTIFDLPRPRDVKWYEPVVQYLVLDITYPVYVQIRNIPIYEEGKGLRWPNEVEIANFIFKSVKRAAERFKYFSPLERLRLISHLPKSDSNFYSRLDYHDLSKVSSSEDARSQAHSLSLVYNSDRSLIHRKELKCFR